VTQIWLIIMEGLLKPMSTQLNSLKVWLLLLRRTGPPFKHLKLKKQQRPLKMNWRQSMNKIREISGRLTNMLR
jgi:hypothetical protein